MEEFQRQRFTMCQKTVDQTDKFFWPGKERVTFLEVPQRCLFLTSTVACQEQASTFQSFQLEHILHILILKSKFDPVNYVIKYLF